MEGPGIVSQWVPGRFELPMAEGKSIVHVSVDTILWELEFRATKPWRPLLMIARSEVDLLLSQSLVKNFQAYLLFCRSERSTRLRNWEEFGQVLARLLILAHHCFPRCGLRHDKRSVYINCE